MDVEDFWTLLPYTRNLFFVLNKFSGVELMKEKNLVPVESPEIIPDYFTGFSELTIIKVIN